MGEFVEVWSIGHSNLPWDRFNDLLHESQIQVVVDVRSYPHSRIAPHFSQDALEPALLERGLNYVFLGRELGGRPRGAEYYDEAGHVLYWRLASSPDFEEGLARLSLWGRRYRVAILCSEENPSSCHRRLLVSRILFERGVRVLHIRANGSVEEESEIRSKMRAIQQRSLLDPAEDPTWKSPQSVLHRSPQKSSSAG